MFKVYREKDDEKKVALMLVEYKAAVELVTVDENGEIDWHVLTIENDGTITLSAGIDEDNEEGIQVDYDGCMKINGIEYQG